MVEEKRKYYVSVQAKTITANQGDTPYEFEIEATPDEVRQLYTLLQAESSAEVEANARLLFSPEVVYDEVVSNERVDLVLKMAYQLIHRLGTPETKAHIESMNVLNGIQHGYSADYES